MFDVIASVLAWFYELIPSYGVAIILLTLTVMLILTPLTLKGTRSMIAMQRLQPEMRRLQQQYKDDRQKLNEELLKFYRENKINPVGGCLPVLLQMPVFIVLYRVISGLTATAGVGGTLGSAVAGGPSDQTFDPSYLDRSSALYQALSNDTEMNFLGMNLAESASRALSEAGVLYALPLFVLILLVAGTSYYQQKQISGRNPQASINPQQQMLLRLMPGFMAVISLGLPAGVVLYFLASNVYRIGQQAFITRTMYRDAPKVIDVPSSESPAKAVKPAKPVKASRPAKPAATGRAASGATSADGGQGRTSRFGRVTRDGGTARPAAKQAARPAAKQAARPTAKPAPRAADRTSGNGRAQPAATPPRPRKKKRK